MCIPYYPRGIGNTRLCGLNHKEGPFKKSHRNLYPVMVVELGNEYTLPHSNIDSYFHYQGNYFGYEKFFISRSYKILFCKEITDVFVV